MADAFCLSFADDALATLAGIVGQCKPLRLEFSIKLAGRTIEDRGRFCCWLRSGDAETGERVLAALQRWRAPDEVLEAARAGGTVAHGLAVGAGRDYRYYRHGRAAETRADDYRAWRWAPGGAPGRRRYGFHFAPETPAGERPEEFVPAALRPAMAALAGDARVRAASGFWLRRDEAGRVDQVDVAFPGNRRLGELIDLAGLAGEPLAPWRALPVRHIAFGADGAVTVYASASFREWPESEEALQRGVGAAAEAERVAVEARYAALPPLPEAGTARAGPDLDAFYGGDIASWRSVLGEAMHYHAGLFTGAECALPSDAEMDAALERAVRCLYPFLPEGGRVYDIGCGWGGPLAMINREQGCRGLGLTVSRNQFRHVAALGLPVRWGDAEATLPPGRFDCALMLESFCHVRDKARLLATLRPFAGRLVMRVNCQDASARPDAFGGTMQMVASAELRALIEAAGWRIVHWRDRRAEALPSIPVWLRRLERIPPGDDVHLETLRAWCRRTAAMLGEWGVNNPLIELVAD
jgi:SAM-dependent methyltransferase